MSDTKPIEKFIVLKVLTKDESGDICSYHCKQAGKNRWSCKDYGGDYPRPKKCKAAELSLDAIMIDEILGYYIEELHAPSTYHNKYYTIKEKIKRLKKLKRILEATNE